MTSTAKRVQRRAAWALFSLFAVLGTSCGGDEESPRGGTPKAAPTPTVVVASIEARDVPVTREFVARTEAVETVAIEARVEAILETMEFEEGREVEAGQLLYKLDARTYAANLSAAEAHLAQAEASLKLAQEQVSVRAAEAGLAQAAAKLKKAEQDVARLRPLAEKDAVPRQDLDTALAGEEVAQAEVQAREAALTNATIQEGVGVSVAGAEVQAAQAALDLARLDLEYCEIRSPLDGLIGRTEVNVGNLVGRAATTTLATVSSVDPMYVTFSISEAEYLQLAARQRNEEDLRGATPIALLLADDSTYPHAGHFVSAERAVAVETGTLQLVSSFPNPDGELRPGQFARARLDVELLEGALLVPQRAIMEQQGAKIVFVVGEGDKVALRSVKVSERFESFFVVTGGLEQGERVIVEGQLKARPGMTVVPADQPVSSESETGR